MKGKKFSINKCPKCNGKGIIFVERKSNRTDISYYDVCDCKKKPR